MAKSGLEPNVGKWTAPPGGLHWAVIGSARGNRMKKHRHIEHVSIRGYRALQDVDLPLGPLNVVIGPNGVGKSSFLDVFKFFSEALGRHEDVGRLLSRRGGIGQLLTRGRRDSLEVTFKARSARPHQGSLSYYVELASSGVGFAIAKEELTEERGKKKAQPFLIRASMSGKLFSSTTRRWSKVALSFVAANELLLPNFGSFLNREAEEFRTMFEDVFCHGAISVLDDAIVRRPQTLEPTSMIVSPGGQNLFSVLYQLRHEAPDWYERILDVLRAGFPGFDRLEFPVVGGGQVTLAWYHHAYEGKPFFANELSAGTLRFLHLVTLLLTPQTPTLILIDEPEDSLHPELIRLIAELLLEAAERMQLIVATQSPALLRWLKPEHIIVADAKEGACTLTSGASLDLDKWLVEYSLDQLWQIGHLGGRP